MRAKFQAGLGIVALASSLFASAAYAEQRVYDVHDLLLPIPDCDVDFGKPSAATATPATSDDQRASLIAMLRLALPAKPDVAIDSDIKEGAIAVTGDASAQAAVADALNAVRQNRFRQIVVQARIVHLNQAAFEAAAPEVRSALLTAEMNNGRTGVELTDNQAMNVLASLQVKPESYTMTLPRLTLFNGQRAAVCVLRETAYTAAFNRSVGKSDVVSFTPDVQTVRSGPEAHVRAMADSDGRKTSVNFRLTINDLQRFEEVKVDGGTIQKPQVLTQQFDTLCAVPTGQTVAISPVQTTGKTDQHTFVLLKAESVVQHAE